jgi:hypothetical protein
MSQTVTEKPDVTEGDESDLDPELTEMTAFKATRVDAVRRPANGFPVLMIKGIAEKDADDPDGNPGCGCCADCTMGGGAMKDERSGEQRAYEAAFVLAKAHRDFTMEERKDLAKRGNALADGSYPIPDADALRRAAILARSGHGNVSAARALIARRAREMGVPNPLAKGPKKGGKKAGKKGSAMKDATGGGDSPDLSGYATGDEVSKIVEAQLAKALAPLQEWMAKAKVTPVPRGPVTSAAPGTPSGGKSPDDLLAKAEQYEQQARSCADAQEAANYRQMAREARDKAKPAA